MKKFSVDGLQLTMNGILPQVFRRFHIVEKYHARNYFARITAKDIITDEQVARHSGKIAEKHPVG